MIDLAAFPTKPTTVSLVGDFVKRALVAAQKYPTIFSAFDHSNLHIVGGNGEDGLGNNEQVTHVFLIVNIAKSDSEQCDLIECDQYENELDVWFEDICAQDKMLAPT